MNFRTIILAAVVPAAVLVGRPADAGVLPTDPAATLVAFKGTKVFNGSLFGQSFFSEVDYAVYKPGEFSSSAALGNPTDPSGGTDYVYTYQLRNTYAGAPSPFVDDPTYLSVGFGSQNGLDPLVVNIGSIMTGTTPNPTNIAHYPNGHASSASWSFASTPVGPLTSTKILFFTSPIAPMWRNGSVQDTNAVFNTQTLPSPIPEPMTTTILGTAMVAMVLNRRR